MPGSWEANDAAETHTLRERACERQRPEGRARANSTSPQDALEELQVHQYELEIQNEELAATQAALAESRDRYRRLYDAAPVGYATLDAQGQIAEVNCAACELLGDAREHALGTPLVHFIAPESLEAFRRHRDAVLASSGTHTCELALHNLAGQRWEVALESSTAYAENPGEWNCALIDISARKQAESHAKQLEKDVMSATDHERSRISRELHDSVSQQMAGLAMSARRVERRLVEQDSLESEAIAEIARELQQATRELRAVVYDLAPPDLEHGDLGTALANLAAETDRAGELTCICSGCDSARDLEPGTAVQLLRIAREAVHNACKHGAPTRIDIVLDRSNGPLELSIEDDGCGFDSATDTGVDRGGSLGLQIMQYRAHLLDAELRIGPRHGGGTVVHCRLPA